MWVGVQGRLIALLVSLTLTTFFCLFISCTSIFDDIRPTPDQPLVGWLMCAMCVISRAPRKVGSML